MNGSSVSETSGSIDAVVPVVEDAVEAPATEAVSFRRRLRRWWWHFAVRQITLLAEIAIVVAGWIGRKRRPIGEDGCEIMLTGRFDSDNWILAHLGPLSASKECKRLWMVSTNPVPDLPKVTAIYPPKWLIRVTGATQARLLTFLWAAMRKRPHVVGGFHLMYNGIAAAVVGRIAGARSMYFCVGGTEVSNDGVGDESNCFLRSNQAAAKGRNRRLRIVSSFDTIITMGTRAVRFFKDNGIDSDFHVVSGGIDSIRFRPTEKPAEIDLILTGRLALVKRIDVFLQAVRVVVDRLPDTKAVIVGDGELREELEQMVIDLGIEHNVTFAGHRDDVEKWLRRSKVFVLTSDLEGLALSVIEAMMSGLPAVVSDVGDLGDLVENGVNGYLVPRRSPEVLADRLVALLSNEQRLIELSVAAHRSALRYETRATTERWDSIISGFRVS